MSDRVGIPKAVDSSGRTFGRKAIEDEPPPFTRPLQCGGCTVTVNPVRGYRRRTASTWVAAHYRLTDRARAPHDEDCRYDFDVQAGRLLHEHRSAIDHDGDIYELRLPETGPRPDVPDVEPPADTAGRDRLTVHPRRGHQLEPTLSAAAAIARLLAIYENDPEARARFTARWNGRRIPWKDFYFDTAHDARHLARVVEQDEHPVAVSGVIKRAGPTTNGSAQLVELDTERGVSHPPTKRWIHIRALSNDTNRLDYAVGQRVLGYGKWATYIPDGQSNNHDVRLWVDHRSVITATDPPVDHSGRGTP